MEVAGRVFINIILAVLSTYIIYEYYKMFFEVKEDKKRNRLIVGAYFVWQMLSMYVVNRLPTYSILLITSLVIITVSSCFLGQLRGKLVFAIIFSVIWMVVESLVAAAFMLAGISIEENEIPGALFSEILLICVVKLLQRFFRHKNVRVLSWKNNAILLVLPIGSMLILYQLLIMSCKVGTNNDVILDIVIAIIILLINVSIFYIYIRLYDALELQHLNSLYQQELDMYNEHMKEKENMMIELRKLKHDLKHKLIFLRDLLADKKYEELEKNMDELIDWKRLTGITIAHSENALIDVLINYKYEIARQNNIKFTLSLDVPISFPLANSDLCVILGNALDNAIEANLNMNVAEPYIDLKLKYKSNQLIIIVENSFDGRIEKDEKGNVITKKRDKENHGIGLSSIEKALEKYQGFRNVEINEKVYKLTMIMHSDELN